MKYVLDASIAVKWVLPEPDSDKATVLWNDYRSRSLDLIAPTTFPVEVSHALTRAERKNILQLGEAPDRLIKVLNFPPVLHDYLVLLGRATELSSQAKLGVYDCLYVALAEQEQCDLLTADSKLLAKLPGFPILRLSALP